MRCLEACTFHYSNKLQQVSDLFAQPSWLYDKFDALAKKKLYGSTAE